MGMGLIVMWPAPLYRISTLSKKKAGLSKKKLLKKNVCFDVVLTVHRR